MTWESAIKKVKKKISDKNPTYSQSNYITICVDDKKYSVRTDCSGELSAMLSVFSGSQIISSSYGFAYDKAIKAKMKKIGFKRKAFPGWSKLKENDILVAPGSHVAVFAKNANGIHYVYSGGSTSSLRNPSYGIESGHNYKYIWRKTK